MLDELYFELYHGKSNGAPAVGKRMVRDLFEEFLAYKARESSSITNLRYAFNAVVRGNYVAENEHLEQDILHFVNTTTVAQVSKNTILRQFTSFLNWIAEEKEIKVPKNILGRYRKRVRTVVLEFTDAEVDQLLAVRPESEFTHMLLVMVETGARPVDVLTLMWDQVDLTKQIVTWKNKITKAPEPRPISTKAADTLRAVRTMSESDKVFRWKHSTLSTLRRFFIDHCSEAKVELAGRSLKHLRTTFKRRMMEKGLPFEMKMYLMRRSSPDVTLSNYTSVNNDNIHKFDQLE